jgi:redox-sensitive bicupin YhaK (pirin superfamily)
MSEARASRRQILGGISATAALAGCTRDKVSESSAAISNSTPSAKPGAREVVQIIDGQNTVDGAGVRLRRSLGSAALPMLDPFLMLDELHGTREEDFIAGFPSHPHRGFETVTYVIEGAMEHQDSLGNHGHLGPGSVQWMTAGRGIIHSEMPKGANGTMWGFQLWVNLPASLKMTRPRYQDLAPERVVELPLDGALVRLVAGSALGRRGPVDGIITGPHMLDVKLAPGGRFEHSTPLSHNAFAYVFQGAALLGRSRRRTDAGQIAIFGRGDVISMATDTGGRLLLLSGEPIGEPVARRGPFVMNTEEELRQAVDDYRTGRLVSSG